MEYKRMLGGGKMKGFPNTVLTGLTERGRKVAKRVGEVEGILEEGG